MTKRGSASGQNSADDREDGQIAMLLKGFGSPGEEGEPVGVATAMKNKEFMNPTVPAVRHKITAGRCKNSANLHITSLIFTTY